MPATYAAPGAETEEGLTNYRVLVGGGAMFDARMGVSFAQITDGTSNTFMVVEAKEPTIWTRPDDLPYDPKGPLPKFGVSPDGFNVLMGDGSVHFVRSTTPQDVLRAYITRAGGEVVPPID
jgi:prepilin-type processing-associated H-X9-DG protein